MFLLPIAAFQQLCHPAIDDSVRETNSNYQYPFELCSVQAQGIFEAVKRVCEVKGSRDNLLEICQKNGVDQGSHVTSPSKIYGYCDSTGLDLVYVI